MDKITTVPSRRKVQQCATMPQSPRIFASSLPLKCREIRKLFGREYCARRLQMLEQNGYLVPDEALERSGASKLVV